MTGAVHIALERPDQPAVMALIEALDAYLWPLYPAESQHLLDIPALLAPQVLFAVARDAAGDAIGCGAVVLMPGYGELKRMYVQPGQRGHGLGRALLDFLEGEGIARDRTVFRLETGARQPEALHLYEKAGYHYREPFGSYRPDPHSLFMEKRVNPQSERP